MIDINVFADDAVRADLGIFTDLNIDPDLRSVTDLSFVGYVCGLVDINTHYSSLITLSV